MKTVEIDKYDEWNSRNDDTLTDSVIILAIQLSNY